jgi:hypothetical protein
MASGSHDDPRVVPTHLADGNSRQSSAVPRVANHLSPRGLRQRVERAREAAMTLPVMYKPCGVPVCRS